MTYLVERLAELRVHLDHLKDLRPRVRDAGDLRRDLSLHNDLLFSLLTVCQLVIDVAGELSARRGQRFEDCTQAVRNLAADEAFDPETVDELARLPGFRNVLLYEYVSLDLERAVAALDRLEPVEELYRVVHLRESAAGAPGDSGAA